MPSGLTKVEVFNLALDLVKEVPIINENDPKATARWLVRNFDHTARVAIRSYPWNCAKEFREIPADVTAPAFKWRYAYTMPAGALRPLPITRYGERHGDQVPHEVVKNKIYTNEPAPLRVILIMDVTANPGAWDDLLVEYVRCALALGMANKFTSKAKYIELASQLLNAAKEQAELIDAYEGSPEPVESFDIIRARYGSEYSISRRW